MNNIFDIVIFSIIVIYLFIASIIDLKTKEVPDWLNFSLLFISISYAIIKAIAYGFSFLFLSSLSFISLFILANILYYGKIFGGGDYKLMIAISPLLNGLLNKIYLGIFIFNLFFIASFYGIFWGFGIFIVNIKKREKRKEMKKEFKKIKKNLILITLLSFLLAIYSLYNLKHHPSNIFIYFAIFFFIFPMLYLLIKLSDKMMIVEKKPTELSEGDLLVNDIKLGNKKIKADAYGLSKEEIEILTKYKRKVKIKEGIPFVPVFFLAFILSLFINAKIMVSFLL